MSHAGDVWIRLEGQAGRITLNRPQALNALTNEMVLAIEQALINWRDDDRVTIVIIDAAGDRAFCAGGDIERLYESGISGDFAFGRRFWTDEYRTNALIADYPKPVISFMQGFVMGGGVGVGCHASHRIVDESAKIAMPECSIGLVPDVGGSLLLARAPGRIGWYLGLTGARMNAADAIYVGFADSFIPRANWEGLIETLCTDGDLSCIKNPTAATDEPMLRQDAERIDRIFAGASALECVQNLEARDDEWAAQTAIAIRNGCPLSVACTHELLTRNEKAATVGEAVEMELRFTWRSMSDGEFLEGVRARIIDKDRNPQWRIGRLEDVRPEKIQAMLAPIVGRV